MEKIDTAKLHNAIRAIVTNSRVNNYAVERVAFGFEKPGDKAPIDLYLEHLRLNIDDCPNRRKDIPGIYIDENECISTKHAYSEFVRELFVFKTEGVFMNSPKDIRLERTGEDLPLLPRVREYLFGLLPLFTEVLGVEVKYNVFDVIPIDGAVQAAEYHKWQKFVTAILLKPLKSGSRINRYVKDFTNAPHYVNRLIEKRGDNFYLKPVNIDNHEFIFALFSLMQFMNDEHGKLLELKMSEWERVHKLKT